MVKKGIEEKSHFSRGKIRKMLWAFVKCMPYDLKLWFCFSVLFSYHVSNRIVAVIIIVSALIMYLTWNLQKNKKCNTRGTYLLIFYSIIRKYEVWIWQTDFAKLRLDRFKKKYECSKYLFFDDMKIIMKRFAPETIFHCLTHEVIVTRIEENFDIIFKEKVTTWNLDRIKKGMRSDKCTECKKKNGCPLFEGEKEPMFYVISFTKKHKQQN